MRVIILSVLVLILVHEISYSQTNRRPTINRIPDYGPILENSDEQTVQMSGISPGLWEFNQTVTITAWSENTNLIDIVHVDYQSPSTTGSLRCTPLQNANGKAKIVVRLDDGMPSRNITETSFTVTVTAVNGAPSFKLSTNTIIVDENSGAASIKDFALDIDDGDPELNQKLNFALSTESITGNLSFRNYPQINAKNGELTFEPNLNTSGEAMISVILKDNGDTNNGGRNESDPQSFKIIVEKKYISPTLDELNPVTLKEDGGEQLVELTGISAGGNNDQKLTITAITNNPELITGITIEYVQGSSTGVLLFTPAPDKFGTAVITVTVNNGASQNNLVSRDLLVTVEPVADTPTVTDATTTRDQQTKSGLVISRNPVDGEEVTHFKISAIKNGTLYHNDGVSPILNNSFITFAQGNAGLKFTPVLGGSGNGSFKIQAALGPQNSQLGGNVITATIQINNDPPVITSIPDSIADVRKEYTYLITATDPNPGDVLSFIIDLPPVVQPWLKYTVQSNGQALIFGTPPSGTVGQYTIKISVSDQIGAYDEQTYTLTVRPPNNLPVLSSITKNIQEDDTIFFEKSVFSSRFSDADNDSIMFWKVVNVPLNGQLFLYDNLLITGAEIIANDLNALIYVPKRDYYGLDVFDWNASDGRDYALVHQRVTIFITPVNDPPELVNFEVDPVLYEFGEKSVSITDSAIVRDVDNDKLEKMTLTFVNNYFPEEDSLYFVPQSGLNFQWKKDAGILTVSGFEKTENYQEALRSIRYVNLKNLAPRTATRQIEIVLYDVDTSSIPYVREIEFEDTFVELDIPSGFTPNRDGTNDTWNIGNLVRYEDIYLTVFSRTGKKIFETNSPYREWDGTYNGSEVPSGVYYYLIAINKYEKVYKGTITVLK